MRWLENWLHRIGLTPCEYLFTLRDDGLRMGKRCVKCGYETRIYMWDFGFGQSCEFCGRTPKRTVLATEGGFYVCNECDVAPVDHGG